MLFYTISHHEVRCSREEKIKIRKKVTNKNNKKTKKSEQKSKLINVKYKVERNLLRVQMYTKKPGRREREVTRS